MTSIAVIAGSTREGSYNRALGELAAASLEAQGARVTRIDLGTFDLPLYSAAIEANAFPADAERLKALFVQQDGLLFVSPEYNGSLSPLLKKNALLARSTMRASRSTPSATASKKPGPHFPASIE